jgi:hypothetical protein
METHEIEYELMPLATVEVDESIAAPTIKEMVEFWMDWEKRLAANGGDYTKTWLKSLGMFILQNHRPPSRPPHDDEGWVRLDGKFGIRLVDWTPWEPDEDAVTVNRDF